MQFIRHTNQEVIYKGIQFIHVVHLIILDLKKGLLGIAGRKARALNLSEDGKRKCT